MPNWRGTSPDFTSPLLIELWPGEEETWWTSLAITVVSTGLDESPICEKVPSGSVKAPPFGGRIEGSFMMT